jgi:hypothetical protein
MRDGGEIPEHTWGEPKLQLPARESSRLTHNSQVTPTTKNEACQNNTTHHQTPGRRKSQNGNGSQPKCGIFFSMFTLRFDALLFLGFVANEYHTTPAAAAMAMRQSLRGDALFFSFLRE